MCWALVTEPDPRSTGIPFPDLDTLLDLDLSPTSPALALALLLVVRDGELACGDVDLEHLPGLSSR